jgi:hypothetical protein
MGSTHIIGSGPSPLYYYNIILYINKNNFKKIKKNPFKNL